MCAKDSGLPSEELHDTFLHKVFSHICIHCCQWIIEEVDIFVLQEKQKKGREGNITLHKHITYKQLFMAL